VAVGDDEARVRAERARAIGLFRYQLIREAADPAHSTKERGKMVRELASREHTDPFGRTVRISRQTIDRWIRDWRAGGFDALVPNPRQCTPRTPAEVLELAVALRRENPERTAAAIRRILRTQLGWAPDERTLQRNFHRLGLTTAAATGSVAVFGRFEAEHPNDLWIGDALHGLRIQLPQDVFVRVPRRSFPAAARLPVGPCRGHRAAGRRAAPGAGLPRRSQGRICR
jgi:putative transposase